MVIVHENRGLNHYLRDVAQVSEGRVLMPWRRMGDYPGNHDEGRELQRTVDGEKLMNDFFAAIEFPVAY